ncbi:hypothetical protein CLOP_g264, partial [Closterium sp. NIES-67]
LHSSVSNSNLPVDVAYSHLDQAAIPARLHPLSGLSFTRPSSILKAVRCIHHGFENTNHCEHDIRCATIQPNVEANEVKSRCGASRHAYPWQPAWRSACMATERHLSLGAANNIALKSPLRS